MRPRPPGSTLFPYTTLFRSGFMGAVRTVDQVLIRAPVARVFQFACEIERWPHILPHYRWVRFLDRRDGGGTVEIDRKSTRLNSSHRTISYAVFCLKKKKAHS